MKKLLITLVMLCMGLPAFGNYRRAKSSYAKRNYKMAASLYYKTYSRTKKNSEKRKSEWGLAQSLQKLGLLYSSSKYYSSIVRRGKKANNPYFRSSLEELGKINAKLSLGRSHITKLFKSKVRLSDIPGPARGFYFYYKGVEAFSKRKFEKASGYFKKVPSSSEYYLEAAFHLGVVSNVSGRHSRAVSYFERVLSGAGNSRKSQEIREMSLLNIARVHYEKKRFAKSISYYGQISRSSENWLDALWESSWAFFFMEKYNNSLGNIHTLHSPFFNNRFYPESFILQAITYLRLCRFKSVNDSMGDFKKRYSPVYGDVKAMLNRYRGDSKGFYKLVYDYKRGKLSKYRNAEQVIKKLSSIDAYKGARDTMRFADRELDMLRKYRSWSSSGLLTNLRTFLSSKKKGAISNAGRLMYQEGTSYYSQLLELSNQTKLIVAEMQLGKLQKLRSLINVDRGRKKVQFIGGLQKLKINETLEYWPFEGEYWEDELGFYVYNLDSRCQKPRGK